MEYFHLIFSSILFFIIPFLHHLISFLKSNPNNKLLLKTLPPGPPKLPLIGNIHQLLLLGDPHRTLRSLAKKYGPLMHLQLGEISTVVISSPEAAKAVMKTHDAIFANRPSYFAYRGLSYGASNIAFSPYGSYWSLLRKICSLELLSPTRVCSFRVIREEEVSSMVTKIAKQIATKNENSVAIVVNLSETIVSLTNSIIARAAFGEKCKKQDRFLVCLGEGVPLITGFCMTDLYPSMKWFEHVTGMRGKVEKIRREVDGILEDIIVEHEESNKRKKGGDNGESNKEEEDLVDVLLKVIQQQNDDVDIALSRDNIKAVILDMFVAGTDTSSTAIIWAMSEIVKNPKVLERAQSEVRRVYKEKKYVDETHLHQLKYLKCIVKETLRLHPPAPLLLPRENKERCEIDGYEIPPNTRTIVNAWAMARDPKYWSEAERFEPERFLDDDDDNDGDNGGDNDHNNSNNNVNDYGFRGTKLEYIPFGSGRRLCPGIAFVTPTIELPLATLLYHFDWKFPNGINHQQFDMTESYEGTLRRKTELCLVPVLRTDPLK